MMLKLFLGKELRIHFWDVSKERKKSDLNEKMDH